MAASSKVRLDLNSPEFQDVFFRLSLTELKQVVASLARLRELDWNSLYRHTGYQWEEIGHLKGPAGARVYSVRLSQKIRAVGYRDADVLRLVSLHPDHDSAYERQKRWPPPAATFRVQRVEGRHVQVALEPCEARRHPTVLALPRG